MNEIDGIGVTNRGGVVVRPMTLVQLLAGGSDAALHDTSRHGRSFPTNTQSPSLIRIVRGYCN
jgi:hypothetical protein